MRLRARAAGEPANPSVDAAAAIVASRVDHATSLVAAQASGVPALGISRDDRRTALQESPQDDVVVQTLKALQGSQTASGTTQAIISQIELGYTHTEAFPHPASTLAPVKKRSSTAPSDDGATCSIVSVSTIQATAFGGSASATQDCNDKMRGC
ncbi:hypothetical protein M885DRAFT_601335 [Pelagophyceae sp. CCMP2097]|nr:hypothetical protein M885DRAFT_601335 [Pelagophyceae sp. CCMP2097]